MAKIVRYNGNLVPFASSSLGTERTIFGEVTQADDITSQFTPDFLRGWGIVGPSDQPTLQDFNAVSYTHGQILAYLHQVGVAEYNAAQEYHIGSLANVSGAIYTSLINSNVGNPPATSPASWSLLNASLNIVGSSRNVRCLVGAAATSATITADQIMALDSLTGRSYRLSSFSKTINIAGTGVGGMDVGAAPVSGAVGIYAIFNPNIALSATNPGLLAVNATSVRAPEIYGGANMPSGYTASALIGVFQTNSSGQFPILFMEDRHVIVFPTSVLNTTLAQGSFTPITMPQVPLNAVSVDMTWQINSDGSSTLDYGTAASSTGLNSVIPFAHTTTSILTATGGAITQPVVVPKTTYYTFAAASGGTLQVFNGGYRF